MSHAVFCTAMGYDFEKLRPFVVSLRKTGFDGRLVMFARFLSPATQLELSAHGVEIVPFFYRKCRARNSWTRFHPYTRFLIQNQIHSIGRFLYRLTTELAVARYFLYADYLQNHPELDTILLADVRDVIFQTNPFDLNWNDALHVFHEAHEISIGQCPYNTQWIEMLFGNETWHRLKDQPICCSGTTLGKRSHLLTYLEGFIQILSTARSTRCLGSDQGIHNTWVHQNPAHPIIHHLNGDGVLTMGHMAREEVRLDSQNRILNTNDEIIPVIHQYNRIHSLPLNF